MTTKRLKYLGVEMIRKDATKSSKPEVGLFRGLRERSDGEGDAKKVIRMILLGQKDKENDLKALNLAVFNVMTLKMMYGDTKELIVLKQSEEDQEKAMLMLESALVEFQNEKRMVDNDPEIVDVTTFDDVPTEFFSPKTETTTNKTSSSSYSYGYGGSVYGGSCGYNDTDWKKKQEEREKEKKRQDKLRWTPMLIKRKGELPAAKVLNAIKKKIAAIAAGEYTSKFESVSAPAPEGEGDEKKTMSSAA